MYCITEIYIVRQIVLYSKEQQCFMQKEQFNLLQCLSKVTTAYACSEEADCRLLVFGETSVISSILCAERFRRSTRDTAINSYQIQNTSH